MNSLSLVWLLTGAVIASIPFLLSLNIISLGTFGTFALGIGCGVLLFIIILTILWNNN
jgi:hypothetical protein